MSLTINRTGDWTGVEGACNTRRFTIDFDSSYPSGGEALTLAQMGLASVTDSGVDIRPKSGYSFEYDYTNNKVLAYQSAGFTPAGSVSAPTFTGTAGVAPLIIEEAVSVSTNTGTLAQTPLYIVAIHVTAGSTTGAFNVIPTGKTPLTTQCAVTFTSGVLTFVAGDAVTAVSVSYIPQRTGTWAVSGNLTVDESLTASASKVNLAARACLVQYVWNDTNSVLCALEPSGEAPTATNTAVVDINDSSNSSIDTHADDDGDTLLVTYVLFSALPDDSMFIDDTDITLSSEAWDFTGDGNYRHLVVPGLGTQLVGEAAAGADSAATWEGPSGTAADGVSVWDPFTNAITTLQTAAMLTTAISWIVFPEAVASPETPAGSVSAPTLTGTAVSAAALTEVAAATDLSALTGVSVYAVGW